MLTRISSRELSEWQAYYQIDPFGNERGDMQAAIVARTMAEIHRNEKKRHEPFTLAEFMPEFGTQDAPPRGAVEVDELTPSAQRAWLEMMNAAFGGRDTR